MISIKIQGFDPDRLEQLAEEQTKIYNEATSNLPNYIPAKVEDVIARFKKETFDQSRMFYAFKNDKMIGYAGLTGRDEKQNLRGVGFPWLRNGVDTGIRTQLYDAMESKCVEEGTKLMRSYASDRFLERLEFFKNRGYETKSEFLNMEKELSKNSFLVPEGYKLRSIRTEDLNPLEEISKQDPKMKTPFNASTFEQTMKSSSFNADNYVVAECNGIVVGFFGLFIPDDNQNENSYFAGVAIHPKHGHIESILVQEAENRAINRGKKRVLTMFFPDSPRLQTARENGYNLKARTFQLDKQLS